MSKKRNSEGGGGRLYVLKLVRKRRERQTVGTIFEQKKRFVVKGK